MYLIFCMAAQIAKTALLKNKSVELHTIGLGQVFKKKARKVRI